MEERTEYCGNITEEYVGKKVSLDGWVQRRRDLGGLIFVDLRDYKGIVQLVFNTDNQEALDAAENLRSEYVVNFTSLHIFVSSTFATKSNSTNNINNIF